MISRFEIEHRYETILERFGEVDAIAIGDETVNYPLEYSIQSDDDDIHFQGVSINHSHELLIQNADGVAGISYFDVDSLNWFPIPLTRLLKAEVSADHRSYWWYTRDFAQVHAERFDLFPERLIENFELLIRLVEAQPLLGMSASTRQANEILWAANKLATYLKYPTFEGFLKIACRKDVTFDGQIKPGRRVRRLTSEGRVFRTESEGRVNLGTLLWHLETEVARPIQQTWLRQMRHEVADLLDQSEDRFYKGLNERRNTPLHGGEASREYGVLLNYICMVIWTTLNP